MPKHNRRFKESAYRNKVDYIKHYDRLKELAISMFNWSNLPETVSERYVELCLFERGRVVFFKDDVLGYLCLPVKAGGPLDIYGIPLIREAYSNNGYHSDGLTSENSVMIFNNMLHSTSVAEIEDFAHKLYDIDQAIIVNAKAQKTPILLSCNEQQKLTLENLYMQYEGNMPFISAYDKLDPNSLKAINTGAPYVADKLSALKTQIWNEALTYLGISNINVMKKERLVSDEVTRNMGGVIASRYSRLIERKQAADKINKMFGLDINVEYRHDFRETDDEFMITQTEDGTELRSMVVDLRSNTATPVPKEAVKDE